MFRSELLAPAGDLKSLHAALAAGADSVYFGLDEGFNARARAANISLDGLEETVALVHAAGARAYLTLNTLVFEVELAALEPILERVVRAGVDALIVADPGLAKLARELCPTLELHASTQMTITSAEAAPFAAELGVTRIVVPRELSVSEIATFRSGTELELETFIMGALCVSWSGQCLSSEAWGGRSANRGRCAQACRLPYSLVVDGQERDLGDVSYLLSPKDLAGFRAVEALSELGVHTLKIEGRQKGPQYVYRAVSAMRQWQDAVETGTTQSFDLGAVARDLSLVYSRGWSDGFLAGSDHQTLVEGTTPRHRGLLLGTVHRVRGQDVLVDRSAAEPRTPEQALGTVSSPLPAYGGSVGTAEGPPIAALQPQPGMGVVFLQGEEQAQEQGGPIFSVLPTEHGWSLRFGRPGPELHRVRPGAQVYVTSDPKQAVKSLPAPPGRCPLTFVCRAETGGPLVIEAVARGRWSARYQTEMLCQPAQNRALDRQVLEEQLGALGGTAFRLERLEWEGSPGLFLPLRALREARRALVEELTAQLLAPDRRPLHSGALARLKTKARDGSLGGLATPLDRAPARPSLVPLCRTDEQLDAVLQMGLPEVELDWMEMVGLNGAVARARQAGLKVGLATTRVQKPGEEVYDRRLQRLEPDSVLLRHWAALIHFRELERRPALHGDFSLNVTNSLTAYHLLGMGLETVTASHDLDARQLRALLEEVPPERVAVTLHHHIPTFHTEHCVYSHLLSQGRDYRTCGRPCEKHQVSLKDRVNLEHPVIVDVGCRNTVFNAQAQSAAFLADELVQRGVRRFRIEFVRESLQETLEVLKAYAELLEGRCDSRSLVERLGSLEQFGVTRGTMQVVGSPG